VELRAPFLKFRPVISLASFYVFLAVVCLAPLPYGSRDPETVAIWCIVLGVALIFAPFGELRQPQRLISWAIIFLLLMLGFILHEQIAERAWFAKPSFVWVQAGSVLNSSIEGSVAVVRREPFFALGPLLVNVLALWLGLIHGCNRRFAKRFLWFVAASSLVYAAIGLIGLLADPTRLLFREREAFVGYLTGTFVDRNTAAVYFGSCGAIWLLLLLQGTRKLLAAGFSRRLYADEFFKISGDKQSWICLAGFFMCLLALFLSGSRAGIVLSLGTLVLAATLYASLDGVDRRRFVILFLIATAFSIGLLLLLGGTFNARLSLDGAADGGRWLIYLSTLRLIGDYPWFGTGLGTYEWVIPAYRSSDLTMWGIWNRAHNSLLEVAAELGLPFAVLLVLYWLAALILLVRGSFLRRRDQYVPLSAFAVALIGVSHSMVEFSLQVPGFAIVAMGIIGVGLAQSFRVPKAADLALSIGRIDDAGNTDGIVQPL